MLTPMLKSGNLDKNVSIGASNPSHNGNGNEASKDTTDSDSQQVESDKPRTLTSPKFSLQLVDENNTCIDLSVGEEKAVKVSSSSEPILVFVDWSDKIMEKYDTHYIENLSEVCKYGPVTKKSRTEPLSLYTCLEAFLREEPLVPDDMWSVSLLPIYVL